MENLLLRHLRQKASYSQEEIAAMLGVEASNYIAIENGELLLSVPQAEYLGGLYDINNEVLYASCLQIEMLHLSEELKIRKNWLINMLTELVRNLRPSKKK